MPQAEISRLAQQQCFGAGLRTAPPSVRGKAVRALRRQNLRICGSKQDRFWSQGRRAACRAGGQHAARARSAVKRVPAVRSTQGQSGHPHPRPLSKFRANSYHQTFGWPEGSALRNPPSQGGLRGMGLRLRGMGTTDLGGWSHLARASVLLFPAEIHLRRVIIIEAGQA
ncbi:hypothetical protein QW71_12760 [Paenibacillus sp. IHB B 3415]|nr:hypothetical protein QW71_12760 [Paenibacillus sp. IHB B 3415]